jgi:predicted O-methyltransferase YrrM
MLKKVMRIGNHHQGLVDFCEKIKTILGNNFKLVEIGSYMGESAEIFSTHFPESEIICIDPWEGKFDDSDPCSKDNYVDVEEQFDLRTSSYPNIKKLKGYSTEFNIECDIVYIDGRHFYEGVKEDIIHWLPMVKKGGIISGHDYYDSEDPFLKMNPHIFGVQKAVKEIVGIPDFTFIDGSWIKIIN